MTENLLTVEQASERLQLSVWTTREHLKKGILRGMKRGRAWRVPESALTEVQPPANTSVDAESIWRQMTSGEAGAHNAALRLLFDAPNDVQQIVMARSAEVANRYYATPEGEAELADFCSLDGEPVHDDEGDYFTDEERAKFRSSKRREAVEAL